MFIDTHCHLNMMVHKKPDEPLKEHDLPTIAQIITDAHRAGVQSIINVGTSLAETRNSILIAQNFKTVYASAGIHPCDATENWKDDFKKIAALVADKEKNKIIAIGETGLDFYHKPFHKERQIDCFKAHIELALKHNLPLIIHVRDSADETLRVMEQYARDAKGVNHCFAQEKYVAEQWIKWGFYLGIDAPITYPKNESFRALLASLPLSSMILETDAPFLPPQIYRGKQNHPQYIPLFAQTLADLHKVSLSELGATTTKNARQLFAL
jgi:TatD DNase family protein